MLLMEDRLSFRRIFLIGMYRCKVNNIKIFWHTVLQERHLKMDVEWFGEASYGLAPCSNAQVVKSDVFEIMGLNMIPNDIRAY